MQSVVLFGLGSLGVEIFRALYHNKKYKIAGVVDNNPSKVDQDAGLIAGKKRTGLKVVSKISEIKSNPDIVIHATMSSLSDVNKQISSIVRNRINVVSTCEQLVYPIGSNKKIAKTLDRLAKKYNVTIVGVGVNPGFLMDSMVLMLSSLCTKINKIKVERIVDLTKRRKAYDG